MTYRRAEHTGHKAACTRFKALHAVLSLLLILLLVDFMGGSSFGALASAYAEEGSVAEQPVAVSDQGDLGQGADDQGEIDLAGEGVTGDGSDSGDPDPGSPDPDSPVDPDNPDPDNPDPDNPDKPDPDNPDQPQKKIVETHLFYKAGTMEQFVLYESDELTPAFIDTYQGVCLFDVQLVYEDGTTGMASKDKVDVAWEYTSDRFAKYAELKTKDLKEDEGSLVVAALGTQNSSNVRIKAKVGETEVIPDGVRIKITGNELSVVPDDLYVLYKDWSIDYWRSTYGAEPQIIVHNGSMTEVRFRDFVIWSDGSTTEGDDGLTREWTVEGCTDKAGNSVGNFCHISQDGVLSANDGASGTAYVNLTITSDSDPNVYFSRDFSVDVTSNQSYVTSLTIVGPDFEPFGIGINLPKGDNVRYMFAKAVYSVYDPDSGEQTKVTKFSQFDTIENLTWNNYRGETTEQELYSTLDVQNGMATFVANVGFKRARVVATIEGASYFGEPVSTSLWISQDVEADKIGTSSYITAKIYHEGDYMKLRDDAPVAREISVTRGQLESLGGTYSDWFTSHRKADSWGTVYARGVSIGSFLSLLGVDSADLRYMEFMGSDGYTGTDGFYSADTIQSTQYRYSNYYMHKVSSSAGYLGQSYVAPMIALDYYVDNSNDYDGSGWAKMSPDSTMRIIIGMSGPDATNGSKSVSCIDRVNIIIADQPEPEEEPGGGGGEGDADANSGDGSDVGGGVGTEEGEASSGQDGGTGQGGSGTSKTVEGTGSLLMHELSEARDQLIERAQLNNPWVPWAALAAAVALVAGAVATRRRYVRDVAVGSRPLDK